MKKIYLGLFLIFVSISAIAQTSYTVGTIRGNASDNTTMTRMNFDTYDNHVAFGKFKDSIYKEPFNMNQLLYGGSSTVHNAYFIVYDAYGNASFAHKLGNTTDSVTIKSAKITNSGNLLVCGSFKGTVDFADNTGNPIYLTSTGTNSDGFVAYYDYLGNLMNAILLDGNGGYASANDLVLDANGYVVVIGNFTGTIDIDGSGVNYDLTSTGGNDGFVATYDGSLGFITAAILDGTGNQIPKFLIAEWNDIIIGGSYDGQFDFDLSVSTNITTSNGGKDIFMMYLDNAYNTINYISLGGAGNDHLKDLRYEYNQGYFCLIDFAQTVNFDPKFGTVNKISSGNTDVAVARYTTNFSLGYVKQFGNANADLGYRLVKNSAGMARGPMNPEYHYIFAMGFNGALDINPDPIESLVINSSNTSINSAIINIDSSGNYVFHGVIEATSIVGLLPTGFNGSTMIVGGNFSGTNVDLLPYSEVFQITHTGSNSGFYMHYNRCQITASKPYILEPYECGTCNVKLAVDNVQGGFPPYSYYWSNGVNYSLDQIGTDLCPNNSNYYDLNITDFYGCIYLDTIWVRGYDPLPALDMNLNVINTSCGNNFGSASATPLNNLGTTSYLWSNGSTNSSTDSLIAGNYSVQVVDDSLTCYYEKTFFIDNSDGPSIAVVTAVDPACGNLDNGSIDVTISGGAAPYTFLWTNGATTEDINGLEGGTYTLTVTDATGCENSLCISLYQPSELYIYQINNYYSSCNFNDGILTVGSYGGFTPYTYQWDANAGSATGDSVANLFAGMYTVTVTDSLGCTADYTFGISDSYWLAPFITYNYITNPNCLGTEGYIDVYAQAYSTFGILNFQWNTGETTQNLVDALSGVHLLQATDDDGCRTVATFYVNQELPNAPTICMVTIDSTATQNVVVWDKSTTQEADYYNIYREGFCNQNDFGIVGSVPFDSLSAFYDTVVNSDTRTWRYYVTAVDTCGFESNGSEIHRTIHLSALVDADTNIVLDWSEYLGMQILGYKVYRKQPVGLLFDYVDSIGEFTTNYLDTIDFTGYGEVEYFVEAVPALVCNATRAYNQNEARSNHSRVSAPQDTSTVAVSEIAKETSIKMYPNPSNDIVNLKVKSDSKNWTLQMMDQTGRIIVSGRLNNQTAFSTKDIASGVYFIRMTSDTNEIHTLKLMIVH